MIEEVERVAAITGAELAVRDRPIVITGGADAWKMAGELKKREVPVIIGAVMARPAEGLRAARFLRL